MVNYQSNPAHATGKKNQVLGVTTGYMAPRRDLSINKAAPKITNAPPRAQRSNTIATFTPPLIETPKSSPDTPKRAARKFDPTKIKTKGSTCNLFIFSCVTSGYSWGTSYECSWTGIREYWAPNLGERKTWTREKVNFKVDDFFEFFRKKKSAIMREMREQLKQQVWNICGQFYNVQRLKKLLRHNKHILVFSRLHIERPWTAQVIFNEKLLSISGHVLLNPDGRMWTCCQSPTEVSVGCTVIFYEISLILRHLPFHHFMTSVQNVELFTWKWKIKTRSVIITMEIFANLQM